MYGPPTFSAASSAASILPAVGASGLDRSSKPTNPTLSDVPAWALAPAERDAENEIGIGSGNPFEEATRMALQDMASRISV